VLVRYQCNLIRFNRENKVDEAVGRISLYIEFSFYDRPYFENIPEAYMPFVGTRMDSNTVSSEKLTVNGGTLYIRNISTSGVPYRCNLVYVNT